MNPDPKNFREGIVILGKARGRRPESDQLLARAAVAAQLWHTAPEPRPYLLIVTRDQPGERPDALRIASLLADDYEIPVQSILARIWSNCTILETRAVRVLTRAHGISRLRILTHPYHAKRAQILFHEVLPDARVVPIDPAATETLLETKGVPSEALGRDLRNIARSMPRGFDLRRERTIEWLLTKLHAIDPRGVFERSLAGYIRPEVSR